eukprot:scaffold4637_cov128-Cylindrotheca_fusiformis.AAC.8
MIPVKRTLVCLLPLLNTYVYGFLPSSSSTRRSVSIFQLASKDSSGEQSSPKRRQRPPRIRPQRPSKTSPSAENRPIDAQARHQQALNDPSLLTNLRFADRSDIHPALKRGIAEVLGLQAMTQIQARTYEEALGGKSILGRSKTGTGKTLAFLLPIVERLLEFDLDLYKPGRNIGIIVVAPTRELAIQIADQAKSLTTFLNDFEVVCVYGGTKIQRDVRLLSPRLPSILVATPGRLLEHLDNTRVGRRKFCDIVDESKIVVLDEADRLFESFPQETRKILSFLPRAKRRQTLLFSATMPKRLRVLLRNAMKIDYVEIDCVDGDSSAKSETNDRVKQFVYKLDTMDDYVSELVRIIQQEMKHDKNYKIIVFWLNIPVLEIHSRLSQASRSRASVSFRKAQKGILFTSDVSARGVDYPDVSLVVQYGAPANRDSYIHRLGRTARAGRAGKGLLVLLPFEKNLLSGKRQLGIRADVQEFDAGLDQCTEEKIEETRLKIRSGHATLTPNAEAAYKAFLAHHINSGEIEPSEVLRYGKQLATCTGLQYTPTIDPKVASRLGLEGMVDDC